MEESIWENVGAAEGSNELVGTKNGHVKVQVTHPHFPEPNVATLGAEIFHAIQCELSEVPRIFAAAGDQWERNVAAR